jgi:tight adherence protein B
MGVIIALTFLGIFAVVAIPLIFANGGSAKASREAAAKLASVINTDAPEVSKLILDFRKNEQMSSIPWLNRKLAKAQIVPNLRQILQQAAIDWTPGRFLLLTGLCFIVPAALVYFRIGALLPSVLIALAPSVLPLGWIYMKRKKRFAKFEQLLPEALDLMVSALRAGHSLLAALGLVTKECPEPLGGEFKICFEEQNYGLELKTALDNLTTRIPLQDLRMVSTAIIIQRESGGNLAEVLDKTSFLIRERFRIKGEIRTHTAQGRLTGWILTCLPLGLGFIMYMMDPQFMSILWHRDIGIKLMWIAAGLILIGGYIIRRIVDIDV